MTQGAEEALSRAPIGVDDGPDHRVMLLDPNTPERRGPRADSTDLVRWTRRPPTAPGGRDPFVMHDPRRLGAA